MALNKVNLYRIDGNLGVISNIQTSAINGGPLAGFRNAVINGNFDIWQRGTSFTNTSTSGGSGTTYTADRMTLLTYKITGDSTTHSITVSQQAFAAGQTDVPNNPTYFARHNTTAVGTLTSSTLVQRLEDVRTFAGKQVTASFWAKASTAVTLSVRFTQEFGTGGSAFVDPAGSVTPVNLTTSWQKFTHTATIPSISGKTVGTSSFVTLAIAQDPMAVMSWDIAQIQVEGGPVATPFEQRPIGTELALCQRYCYVVGGDSLNQVFATSFNTSPTTANAHFFFPVRMRGAPTLIVSAAGDLQISNGLVAFICTSVTTGGAQSSICSIVIGTVASGLTTSQATRLEALSLNARMIWNAEL